MSAAVVALFYALVAAIGAAAAAAFVFSVGSSPQ